MSFLVSFALFYFVFFDLFWFHVCVCVCVCARDCVCVCPFVFIFVWFFFYYLSGVWILLLLIFCFFVLIPFIAITNSLCGLGSLNRCSAWISGVGALSPGYYTTRELLTSGRINQCELTRRPPLVSNSWNHLIACNTQCRMPHWNDSQVMNRNPVINTQASHRHPKHTTSHGPAVCAVC